MRNKNELKVSDLKCTCNPDLFEFTTTDEIEDKKDLVYGQERGIKALDFGTNVDIKGYNLYLEGPTGVGKTMYTQRVLREKAKKDKVPNDWVYVYNFDNPNEPIAISFPAGQGQVFKDIMDSLVKDVRKEIKKVFNQEDFEKEKALIKQDFEAKKAELLEKLNKRTIVQGFQVKASDSGVYMMPVLDGKVLEEKEYDALPDDLRHQFEERSNLVQDQIFEALSQIKALEKAADKRIEEWQSNIALLAINVQINAIKLNYKRNKKITQYLENVKIDILKNVEAFLAPEPDPKHPEPQPNPMQKPELKQPWLNYRVNLFVDNSKLEGVPVIMDTNYSFHNIFGGLEYENSYGMLKTDFTMNQTLQKRKLSKT